jgi:hypothetical protein
MSDTKEQIDRAISIIAVLIEGGMDAFECKVALVHLIEAQSALEDAKEALENI